MYPIYLKICKNELSKNNLFKKLLAVIVGRLRAPLLGDSSLPQHFNKLSLDLKKIVNIFEEQIIQFFLHYLVTQ
ncbi:hypothetical protein BpHYR1_022531 [Brachionus plicatilis]|uniref:Uncharacterized protein n=1 Tax=Brachionus plicatilis TaxID=10195 RepID=A0A3M7SWL7_BRAPC|nr:hypothetical protein BpHYR1_022531 [Brachionus plicatilis]